MTFNVEKQNGHWCLTYDSASQVEVITSVLRGTRITREDAVRMCDGLMQAFDEWGIRDHVLQHMADRADTRALHSRHPIPIDQWPGMILQIDLKQVWAGDAWHESMATVAFFDRLKRFCSNLETVVPEIEVLVDRPGVESHWFSSHTTYYAVENGSRVRLITGVTFSDAHRAVREFLNACEKQIATNRRLHFVAGTPDPADPVQPEYPRRGPRRMNL